MAKFLNQNENGFEIDIVALPQSHIWGELLKPGKIQSSHNPAVGLKRKHILQNTKPLYINKNIYLS